MPRLSRWMVALLSLATATQTLAERFITIPMGRKVPYKAVKLQVLWDQNNSDLYQANIGIGIAEAFDIELNVQDFGRGSDASLDFAYSFVDPVVGYGPGISIGIRDILDETPEGLQVFISTTTAVGNNADFNQDTPTLATVGVFFDDRKGKFFVGVSQPLTNQVLIIAEHDSRRLVGGFEIRPLRDGWARFIYGNKDKLIQVGYLRRF